MLLWPIVYILVGLSLLIWSGDRFVTGAAALARNLGMAPMLVGLTIVAFGTSAPEIFVAVVAAWKGNPGIAVGDAIGSNIANIGMVIGLTAIIIPLSVHSQTLKREFPLLLVFTALTFFLLFDGVLGRFEGVVLIISLVLMLVWLLYAAKEAPRDEPMVAEYEESLEKPLKMTSARAVGWLCMGLILLPLSSHILVNGAVDIARHFGVSDVFIGLTIIAIGTSLPEAATSIISAIKGEPDIALGNIIGSNIFNLLAVLGAASIITPLPITHQILTQDYLVMVAFTIALGFMSFSFGKKGQRGRINRFEGAALLLAYIGYLAWLIRSAI